MDVGLDAAASWRLLRFCPPAHIRKRFAAMQTLQLELHSVGLEILKSLLCEYSGLIANDSNDVLAPATDSVGPGAFGVPDGATSSGRLGGGWLGAPRLCHVLRVVAH